MERRYIVKVNIPYIKARAKITRRLKTRTRMFIYSYQELCEVILATHDW